MKRILSAIIFTGILLILAACGSGSSTEQSAPPTEIPPTAAPTEEPGIHLSADGSGDYPDLGKAVTEAEAGETIYLAGGTYRLEESLVIDKAIALVGDGRDKTIIISSAEGNVLRFVGEGLFTLEGLTVQHEGALSANVVRVDSGEINISNCHLTGAAEPEGQIAAGLAVLGNTTGSVKNCFVNNNAIVGIFLSGDSNITLEDNTCDNNNVAGIAFRDNASGLVKNNSCNNNGFAGFYLFGNGDILLQSNQCS